MRKAFMGMVALMLGSALYPTGAQAQGTPVQFSVGGGVDLPLGDFDDAAKLGFHGLVGVSYAPAEWKGFGIQGDGNFSRFSDDTDLDINFQMIYGTANALYKFQTAETTRFKPYLIGGIGVYNLDVKGDDVPTGVDSETKFGINAGAGFDIGIGGGSAALFLEGRFHNVFTEDESTQFIPFTVGVRFGGGGS
jgi:opacity protein-like surface antigen